MDVWTRWEKSFHNAYELSNHHDTSFKYLTIVDVNYVSVKLKFYNKDKKENPNMTEGFKFISK